jgi:lysine 6-dehydrogenase
VELDGRGIKPRDVVLKVLEPIVELGDKDDVVLLRVTVDGKKEGKHTVCEYEMITYKDRKNKVTAMARSTAYTISAVAQMIAKGVIKKRGVFTPEEIVDGKKYIREMKKRGVVISEKRMERE